MTLTRQQFLERCATAYDTGRAAPEVLQVLERWADMVMRLEGGQMDIFFDLLSAEKERTNSFLVKLANDADGYRAIEFMATLRNPCHACSTDRNNIWVTRWGFCPHTDEERVGTKATDHQQRQDAHIAEQLAALKEQLEARRELGRSSMPVELRMMDSLLWYIGELEKRREIVDVADPG